MLFARSATLQRALLHTMALRAPAAVRCPVAPGPFAATYRASQLFSSSVEESDVVRKTGTVKWFSVEKGFGFIVPEQGGNDVFVHQTQIHAEGFRSLAEGELVEYDVETDQTGRPRAVGVTGPDGAFVQGAPRPPPRYDDDDF